MSGIPQRDSRDSTTNMDPEQLTPRPTADACRPQTVGSSSEGKKACSHRRLQRLLSASTTERDCLPWKTVQELGSKVHEVISQKDKELLRCLVECHKAPLEERNEQGLTPLYNAVYSNWSDGALLLLRCGADVHSADSRPENLCSSHKPLIHLAMKTGSLRLVGALIKRGANITVRDLNGNPCVRFHRFSSPDDLFKFLASSVTNRGSRRTDLLKDLLFVIRAAVQLAVKRQQVQAFIKKQPSCHQSKMFQLYAACFCFLDLYHGDDGSDDDDDDDDDDAAATVTSSANDHDDDDYYYKDDNRALHYWRMSAKCTPCKLHDHTMEEKMAFRSVFADILDVEEHPLPDRVTTDDDKLPIHIAALLAVEQHMPEDNVLVMAVDHVCEGLIAQGKIVDALGVFRRLTTIRPLFMHEIDHIALLLQMNLGKIGGLSGLPLSAVIDVMQTTQNCLSSFHVSCSKSAPSFHGSTSRVLRELFHVLLQTMNYCHSQKVLAAPEQLQHLTFHVKDFLRRFPSTDCPDVFHQLQDQCTAAMIKDLVAYSAEVRGKVRQVKSPLHLLSDEDGDTPLHCLARERSHEDLVQEEVLQCFLDNGADLCTRNNEGETVRSILVRRGVYTEGELLPSLQCLAAAAFMGDRRLRQTVQDCRPAAVKNFLLDH